jgi:hypothetical protein
MTIRPASAARRAAYFAVSVIIGSIVSSGVVLWLAHDARAFLVGVIVGAVLLWLFSRLVDVLVIVLWGSALATYYHSGRKKR